MMSDPAFSSLLLSAVVGLLGLILVVVGWAARRVVDLLADHASRLDRLETRCALRAGRGSQNLYGSEPEVIG